MKFSLRVKILLFTVLLIILISTLTGILITNRVTESIEEQIRYRLSSLASTMAMNAEDPIVMEDDIYLAGIVKDAMENRGFQFAEVLDTDYNILASDDIANWGSVDSSLIYADGNEFIRAENSIQIIKPVKLGDRKTVGYIKLGISTDEIARTRSEIILIISIITLVFIFAGIVLAVFFSSFITRQLKGLMRGVKMVAGGDLNVKVEKVSSDELGVLTDTFNEMVVNLREKEMIKRAFSRYVSKQVAEKVFEDPDAFLDKLKGERVEVSVMFADIMGFTPMSEAMDPEDVVSILNTYLSRMTDSVFKHEGTLDKFIGDCVMAVFGAPILLDNPSLNAVRSAIDIQKNIAALNLKRRSEGLKEIKIGIGVNTGEAVVGNIGSSERLDYTVIGDNVNLAARLQAVANSNNIPIIVSKTVVSHIEGIIDYRELEPVMVKGKSKPVDIFSINIE